MKELRVGKAVESRIAKVVGQGGIEPLSEFGHLGSSEPIVNPTCNRSFFVLDEGCFV